MERTFFYSSFVSRNRINERGRGKYYDIGYRSRNILPYYLAFCSTGWQPVAPMKAKVYVTLKPSVLDPQGKAIKHSVELLGYNGIQDVRQGKYFEIALNGELTEEDARTEATRMAREILTNPIIEDFRVEIEK